MSDDPAQGIANAEGRFHQIPNVQVVGPALFPTIGSPTPMLTGIALARRAVDKMIAADPAVVPASRGFTYLFDGTEATAKSWQIAGSAGVDLIDGNLVVRPGNNIGLMTAKLLVINGTVEMTTEHVAIPVVHVIAGQLHDYTQVLDGFNVRARSFILFSSNAITSVCRCLAKAYVELSESCRRLH